MSTEHFPFACAVGLLYLLASILRHTTEINRGYVVDLEIGNSKSDAESKATA